MEILSFVQKQVNRLTREIGSYEDAQDLIQDVCEIIWRKKDYFEQKDLEQQKNIAIVALRNRWKDIISYNKATKRDPDYLGMVINTKPRVYSMLELKDLIKVMEERNREGNNMRYLTEFAMGYTAREVMARNKMNLTTLHAQISKSRKKLKHVILR